MPDLVTLTIDGKTVKATAGTLVIDAAKQNGIEIPSFCYYEGLSLQAACRMCLVEIEKAPKLMVGCTTPVAEGMVVHTDSPTVRNARKMTLEFLLTNHPLDCPVCDKGGECELQDMVFRYGAGESRFAEMKHHVDEKQWSPVVFYDGPRCILCYRCIRICDEGMGVGALGIINRGVLSEIAPNKHDHLECDECGACIDICPVGALTSGAYRYKTRPWEMEHQGTICTHCSNGCKTTLGVRNGQIIRANNRDKSGINGEFLCMKGRYAFDFVHSEERLQSPMKRVGDTFEPISWADALATVSGKFTAIKARSGKFGIIGSNHTTNEENAYLRRFAREGLGTGNIDHHRTGDVGTLMDALGGRTGALATVADLYAAKAALVVGSDLSQQHPLLAYQIRASKRHHNAHIYAVTPGPVREDKYAFKSVRAAEGRELEAVEGLREQLKGEADLVILFGDTVKGDAVRKLVAFGDSLGIPVKYVRIGGLFEFARRFRRGTWTGCRGIGLRRDPLCDGSGSRMGGRRQSAEEPGVGVHGRVGSSAGSVHDRDGQARRHHPAGSVRIREERDGDQRDRRDAETEGGCQGNGHQAGPGNLPPDREGNGDANGCGWSRRPSGGWRVASGEYPVVSRYTVHFRHVGTVFESAQFGNGSARWTVPGAVIGGDGSEVQ